MPDTSFIILIVFMVLVSTITTTLVLVVIMRRRREMSTRVGKDTPLGEALRKPGRRSATTGDGTEYEFRYSPGGKNTPSSFIVTVQCPSEGAFQVGPESGFDTFAKRTGLAREIQTGDPEFDDKYFIQSNKEEFAAEFLRLPEKRQAIDLLLRIGFSTLRHDGKTMQAVWSPFSPKDRTDESFVPNAATLLVALTKDLPQPAHARPISAPPPAWKAKRVIAFAIPLLAHMIGIPVLLVGLTTYKPLDVGWVILDSLMYSVPCLLLFCYVAVLLVKGRSTSHKELVLILAFALAGIPIAGVGLEMALNGCLDPSEPRTHTAKVINKYISESDKSKSYHAIVESWRDGRDTEKLGVSSQEYHRLREGKSMMNVTTKPGRFGFEWIVSKEIGKS